MLSVVGPFNYSFFSCHITVVPSFTHSDFLVVVGHACLLYFGATSLHRFDVAMSMSRLFTIIGDNNVLQNMTSLNTASRESMKKAQIIPCPPLSTFEAALNGIRSESSVCICAGITDHLLSARECSTIYGTIEPVFNQLRDQLFKLCSDRPALQVRLEQDSLFNLFQSLIILLFSDL